MNKIEIVIDVPFLAREINDAHRQIIRAGKSIIVEARRAGEALIEVKRRGAHGTFASWVAANCECSYRTARKYMQAAKLADIGHFDPTKGLDSFLDAHATPRQPEPPSAPREFTREDAERALKLHALAERGSTKHEQAAASTKLSNFAKEFGMTPEAVVSKARALLPDEGVTEAQAKYTEARAAWEADAADRKKRAEAAEKRIKELEEKLEKMAARREELFKDLRSKSKDQLLDLLVSAQLQLEGFGA